MTASRKAPLDRSRILLVDDNHHGNVARKTLLEESGFEVETALSGEEALVLFEERLFEARPFDVVVTDLRMGKMNGTELIARIRTSEHHTFTILLSGFAACLGLTEKDTGADAVLNKSSKEQDQLARTVTQLLNRRSRRKPVASQKKAQVSVARSG